jgi:hypothetical protein
MDEASRACTGMLGRVRLGGFIFIACAVAAMVSSGCCSHGDDKLEDLGHDMDQMSHEVAKYGTMGISSPVLAAPNSDFAFNLTPGSDDFYNDAKSQVQGSVSQLQQTALSVGAGLSASFNPALGASYLAQLQQYQQAVNNNNNVQNIGNLQVMLKNQAALTTYQQSVAAANQITDPNLKATALTNADNALASSLAAPATQTVPSFPTATAPAAPSGNLVSRPTNLLQSFANSGNFAGLGALNPNAASLSVTDRTAILTAAGDNATKAIFQLIGDPSLANEFKGKQIIFGVVTVSVEPGWMTRKGYAADVITNVRYQYVPARTTVIQKFMRDPAVPPPLRTYFSNIRNGIPNETAPQVPTDLMYNEQDSNGINNYGPNPQGPHVAVVSPLTDTETLDLSSSSRQEQDVALSLNIAAELAAAGASGQAQAFLNYAKSLQKDVQTRTPDVVANAFSEGSSFGFQIGPELRAVEEVQSGKFSEAAEILDRQSFPALVIFGVESGVYEPKVRETNGQLVLYEPVLKLESANKWARMPIAAGDQPQDVLFTWIGRIDDSLADVTVREPVYPTEHALAELSRKVTCDLRSLTPGNDPWPSSGDQPQRRAAGVTGDDCNFKSNPQTTTIPAPTYYMVWNRLQALRAQLFGSESTTYLPEAYLELSGPMKVASVQPSLIAAGTVTTIAIIGEHLDEVDTNNIGVASGNVEISSATMQPVFNASMENHVLLLQVTPKFGRSTAASINTTANLAVAQDNEQILAQTVGQQLTSQEQSLIAAIQAKIPDPVAHPKCMEMPGEVADLDKQLASVGSQTATLLKALDNRAAWQALNLDWANYLVSSNTWTPTLEKELDYYVSAFSQPVTVKPGTPPPTGLTPNPDYQSLKGAIGSLTTLIDEHGKQIDLVEAESNVTNALNVLQQDAQADAARALRGVNNAVGALPNFMTPLNLQMPTDSNGNRLDTTLTQTAAGEVNSSSLPAIGNEQLSALVANLHQAFADDAASGSTSDSIKNLNGNAVTTAQRNLAAASDISNGLNGKSSSAAGSAQNGSAGGQMSAQLITQAQGNLDRAKAGLEELAPVEAEPIILKLTSQTDPSAIAFTPPITVTDGDPCNLAIAPQMIQLQAPASGGGAGSSTSSTASGSTPSAAPPTQSTVIIAGNDLDRVNLTNITMVQASGSTLISTASMVGDSIQLTITAPTTAGSVYFVLPISGTTRSVATPPISVNAAPQNSSPSAQTGAAPSVSSVQQIQVSPDQTPAAVGSSSPIVDATFLLTGNNLNQIDLSSVVLSRGLNHLTHQSLVSEPNETDCKMQRFGQLLSRFDRQPTASVHERAERLRVNPGFAGNFGVRPFVVLNRLAKFVKNCHEIHNNRMVAT